MSGQLEVHHDILCTAPVSRNLSRCRRCSVAQTTAKPQPTSWWSWLWSCLVLWELRVVTVLEDPSYSSPVGRASPKNWKMELKLLHDVSSCRSVPAQYIAQRDRSDRCQGSTFFTSNQCRELLRPIPAPGSVGMRLRADMLMSQAPPVTPCMSSALSVACAGLQCLPASGPH
ncbi:hypothetical protein J4Q44_G00161470 [Coregonus suidteri]|uniref:Uncharacterized protein n=1 Tax=Coregonus suidteri TaxID=861788 RepID=A0AAN8QQP5_9TELE